jgi:hypothetical protein
MKIRKYETNGPGYIRAEIEWSPTATYPASDVKTYNVPGGGIASLSVKQEAYYVSLSIVPDDIPYFDNIQLPILPGQELPQKIIGAAFPASHYSLPYVILPLDDTKFGFALNVGLTS